MSSSESKIRSNLQGLEGFSGKLSASEQRRLFGRVLFGRKDVVINDIGVSVFERVCFGTDANIYRYSFAEIEGYLNGSMEVPRGGGLRRF